jgi:hypothetical protein
MHVFEGVDVAFLLRIERRLHKEVQYGDERSIGWPICAKKFPQAQKEASFSNQRRRPAKAPLQVSAQARARHRRRAVVMLTDDGSAASSFGFKSIEHRRIPRGIDAQLEWETNYWDHLVAHVDIGVDVKRRGALAVDTRAMTITGTRRPLRDRIFDERRCVYLPLATMADAQKAACVLRRFLRILPLAALVTMNQMGAGYGAARRAHEKTDMVRYTRPRHEAAFSSRNPRRALQRRVNIPTAKCTRGRAGQANGVVQYKTPP